MYDLWATMRIVGRPAQNWNREFTFNGELAEISGGTKSGDPPFPFFLPPPPPPGPPPFAVCIGVTRLFRARLLVPARAHTEREGTRKTRRKRVTKIATVYHHQVDGYPGDACTLFIVAVSPRPRIHFLSMILRF